MNGEIVVLITASAEDEAARIAREIVGAGLAGCVNIVKNVRSIYRWQGAVEDGPEVLMIAKTRRDLFGQLADRVRELHSYSVPEIVALPILDGSPEYLGWLREVTSGG